MTLHPTRPGVFVDRTGERYGRLVVLRRADASPNGVMWLCQCDCGRTKAVLARHLAAGVIQSCGCGRGKPTGLRGKGKHRDRATASSWQAMWDRCTHSYHPAFNRYGGRGITVCDRWRSFENFLADMGPRPPGLSLDRINNDGNYEPGNCRWATQRQQRDNAEGKKRLLTHRGETLRLKEWARRTGLGTTTLRARLQRGWSVERTLETPLLGGGSR